MGPRGGRGGRGGPGGAKKPGGSSAPVSRPMTPFGGAPPAESTAKSDAPAEDTKVSAELSEPKVVNLEDNSSLQPVETRAAT